MEVVSDEWGTSSPGIVAVVTVESHAAGWRRQLSRELPWIGSGQPAPEGADLKWAYDPIPPLVGYCWGIGLWLDKWF